MLSTCSLLPLSTGLGSCDPSWHWVPSLPPSSVPAIQPALLCCQTVGPTRRMGGEFSPSGSSEHTGHEVLFGAHRPCSFWLEQTGYAVLRPCWAGPSAPGPLLLSVTPVLCHPWSRPLLCSLLETGCSFLPCFHGFAQAFPSTLVYFICQSKSCASRSASSSKASWMAQTISGLLKTSLVIWETYVCKALPSRVEATAGKGVQNSFTHSINQVLSMDVPENMSVELLYQ